MTSISPPLALSQSMDKNRKQQHERDVVIDDDAEDPESIPYHARYYARPFTYGTLPEGFKTSELNHVELESDESPKPIRTHAQIIPNSPKSRRPLRPSISPSRPVLHKTPTREEFEEMLMERREQAMREQNNVSTKIAQDAAIRKDLDELQEKLNKDGILKATELPVAKPNRVGLVETIALPDATAMAVKSYEPALIVAAPPAHTQKQPKRSETPDFPVVSRSTVLEDRCTSPYPYVGGAPQKDSALALCPAQGQSTASFNSALEGTAAVNNTHNVEPHMVKFAKDSSKYWYKPHMTRAEAVALLMNSAPGNFIIRNSTTYPNAYGLVLRVAQPPPGVIVPDDSQGDELVRHYLLEPTAEGVRLKGCPSIFTSLSALVYQYSINQLALPCKLVIPDGDDLLELSGDAELIAAQRQLLSQGAACNVLYLFTCNTEMLTGDVAIRKAVNAMYLQRPLPKPIEVHFKVSQQGITLTDNKRLVFFRKHYTKQNISHIGIDPDNHFWTIVSCHDGLERTNKKTIFAFVARSMCGSRDNECHVFCDLAALTQPASAIISFALKVLPMDAQHYKLV